MSLFNRKNKTVKDRDFYKLNKIQSTLFNKISGVRVNNATNVLIPSNHGSFLVRTDFSCNIKYILNVDYADKVGGDWFVLTMLEPVYHELRFNYQQLPSVERILEAAINGEEQESPDMWAEPDPSTLYMDDDSEIVRSFRAYVKPREGYEIEQDSKNREAIRLNQMGLTGPLGGL